MDFFFEVLGKVGAAFGYLVVGFFAFFMGLIALAIFFGKQVVLNLEAGLVDNNKRIAGEVDIKKYKKETPFFELKTYRPELILNKDVEVYVNNRAICRFKLESDKKLTVSQPTKSKAKHEVVLFSKEKVEVLIQLDIKHLPKIDQVVAIKSQGEFVLEGVLRKD